MRKLVLAAAGMGCASGCTAERAPAHTGHPVIDSFIADIGARRRDDALSKLSTMESATGEPNAVRTTSEFVDKLLDCSYLSTKTYERMPDRYDVTWRCPDGDYYSSIDPGYRPPRLTIGQFVSTATREEWRKRGPAPPPPPPPVGNPGVDR